MKNLQTEVLKIATSLVLIFSFFPADAFQKIKEADSLFQAKQYTQSMELYQSVLAERKYSSAMLLKMAFIEEGLGKVGLTLYYLKLYYLASDDEQALHKMEELASKFKLNGFAVDDAGRLKRWVDKNIIFIQTVILGITLIAVFVLFLQRKKNNIPWGMTIVILLALFSVAYFNNFYSLNSVIVAGDRTYLMDGPSAGASVAGIVDEGNQLETLGQDDVWLKVKWMDKVVYVKKNSVLTVAL